MKIVGIDPSLTATGYATGDTVGTIRPKLAGPERMILIRDTTLDVCSGAGLVVMEAPAFASRGRSVKEIGGIWWVIRVALHEAHIPTLEVPPPTLKKYATGKGNANKVEVLKAAWERLGYDGTDDNESDALWLRQIGVRFAAPGSQTPIPTVHDAAADKIQQRWDSTMKEMQP